MGTRQILIRKGKGNKEQFVLFTHECAERLKGGPQNRTHKNEYLSQPLTFILFNVIFP